MQIGLCIKDLIPQCHLFITVKNWCFLAKSERARNWESDKEYKNQNRRPFDVERACFYFCILVLLIYIPPKTSEHLLMF